MYQEYDKKLNFTTDTWMSFNHHAFVAIAVHPERNGILLSFPLDVVKVGKVITHVICYASRQTYVEVNDTYSEGGTHKETLRPQSNTRVMNKRQGDKGTIKRIVDS